MSPLKSVAVDILHEFRWSPSLWTTLTLLLGKLASAAMSRRLGSQMKDFSDTTTAFPPAKGAFVLDLVNLLSQYLGKFWSANLSSWIATIW